MSSHARIERESIEGPTVPADAYYGVHDRNVGDIAVDHQLLTHTQVEELHSPRKLPRLPATTAVAFSMRPREILRSSMGCRALRMSSDAVMPHRDFYIGLIPSKPTSRLTHQSWFSNSAKNTVLAMFKNLTFTLAAAVLSIQLAAPQASAETTGLTPCRDQDIMVVAKQLNHYQALVLTFSLISDQPACTLTGYPTVGTLGAPKLRANPVSGEAVTTVQVGGGARAQAIVESTTRDAKGDQCRVYRTLEVTPPQGAWVLSVPAPIVACSLEVHPITAAQ
ncbi:DUF4232 domain-containing protein [Nocardia sp. NPDC052566]|uniref:DUF4232 domain-containing protein n=1 Tax=Nocardia sp. NPDC052566 TaxID=3364330 RepID=UPI0037C6AEC4